MDKKLLGAGMALILAGCASVEMAQYTVTSFAEVPLKEKAKVKIVTANDNLGTIVKSVSDAFRASGKLSVVDSGADYWFVLSGVSQYVKGTPQTKITVVKKENASGGQELFAEESLNFASAANGVSVAVYDAKTLAPVYYFEVPNYSGDRTKGSVRTADIYASAFGKEVAERISDALITQQKQVETPIPLEADGKLRELFIKGGEMFAKEGEKAYKPFLVAYQPEKINLTEFCEKLRTKTYEGSDAAKKLGNHYLFLLVKEALRGDHETLAKIRDDQLMILEASEAKGIVEAVPVALARLEYKLANIGE